jgi:hypothetical protein
MGDKRNAYRILMQKPERNESTWTTTHKWEYNIKIDLKEMGWKYMY